MCGKAILMCLIPILVGVIDLYDGINCFKTPLMFKGLALVNEVKEVLIHIRCNSVINVLNINMSNSAGLDETPCFAASHLGLRYF